MAKQVFPWVKMARRPGTTDRVGASNSFYFDSCQTPPEAEPPPYRGRPLRGSGVATTTSSDSYVYADYNYSSSSEDEPTQVLVPKLVRRRRVGAKTFTKRRPPATEQFNNNSNSDRWFNYSVNNSYDDPPLYSTHHFNDVDDYDNDQFKSNSTGFEPIPRSRRQYVEARRLEAKLLGQKKRRLGRGRGREEDSPRTPKSTRPKVYVIKDISKVPLTTKTRSKQANPIAEEVSRVLNKIPPHRNPTKNKSIIDVMPTPKIATEAKGVQMGSAGDGTTTDDHYSSEDNPSTLRSPSTDDAESPRLKPRYVCTHTPAEKLMAAGLLAPSPSSCHHDNSARDRQHGRHRQVDLLYIGGLFTLSLLLLYMFLWRLSRNQTKSVWNLLWQELNALFCIT